VSGSPKQPPEASLSVGEQVDEALRTLTDQSAWMRDRLGEEDWRRLTRLRGAWVSCGYVFICGRNALVMALALVAFGLVMTRLATGSWRPREFEWGSVGGVLCVLGPTLLIVGWAGARVTQLLLGRELERLGWRGHSPEAIA
jgi:hypothetical protein